MTPTGARRAVIGVVLLGAVLRLWCVLAVPPHVLHGDEISYWRRAATVIATGDPGDAMQPPLIAYVLAAVRVVNPDGIETARLLNVVWYVVGVVALVALAGTWPRAVVPMSIYALHPVWIGFAAYLWTEPLFLALVLAAFALAERGGAVRATAAGATFGLAQLTRPLGLPIFAIALARYAYETWPPRTPSWRPAIMALAFAVVVSP